MNAFGHKAMYDSFLHTVKTYRNGTLSVNVVFLVGIQVHKSWTSYKVHFFVIMHWLTQTFQCKRETNHRSLGMRMLFCKWNNHCGLPDSKCAACCRQYNIVGIPHIYYATQHGVLVWERCAQCTHSRYSCSLVVTLTLSGWWRRMWTRSLMLSCLMPNTEVCILWSSFVDYLSKPESLV